MRLTKLLFPSDNTKTLRFIKAFDYVSVINQTKYPLYVRFNAAGIIDANNYDYIIAPFEKVSLLGGSAEYSFNFALGGASSIDNTNHAIVLGIIDEVAPKFISRFTFPLPPREVILVSFSGSISANSLLTQTFYTTSKTEYARVSSIWGIWNGAASIDRWLNVYLTKVGGFNEDYINSMFLGPTFAQVMDVLVPPENQIKGTAINDLGSSTVLTAFLTLELYNR